MNEKQRGACPEQAGCCGEVSVCTRLVWSLRLCAGAYVMDGGKMGRLKRSPGFLWGQKVSPGDGPYGASWEVVKGSAQEASLGAGGDSVSGRGECQV